ncbi:MAG TPA: RnfABCDGE type electron transport complex subunit D [Gemmatimonadota bacterium]|nr:RnfABCDGE type electron transport complex subunit D [Gemmatimonadota bacterium]
MRGVRLELTAPPHLKAPDSTRRIMWSVVGSLVPVIAVATYFFGPSALLVIASATAGAVLTERLLGDRGSLGDGSAAITGLLLGLILPAGLPMWMAFLGGAFGIGFGKLVFGGLGQNVFNPALIGRAFLQAAFPTAITTWPAQGVPWGQLRGDNFALPLLSPNAPDVVTAATPLGLWKFEAIPTDIGGLMLGNTGGSIGETAGLLILVCGGYLALKNYLNWRIPVSIFVTVAAASGLLHGIDGARYPGPLFMLFSGGLILGAMYMATDMVTSPVTNTGAWIFGVGIGVLVVLIRTWGGLPEGVMYAILLMNALVPFINRATQPRVFGHGRNEAPA